MQNINISLPEALKQFVDWRITSGEYASPSDYLCKLILNDEKLQAQDWLEQKLLDGINSPTSEMQDSDWQEIRQEALNIIASKTVQH